MGNKNVVPANVLIAKPISMFCGFVDFMIKKNINVAANKLCLVHMH